MLCFQKAGSVIKNVAFGFRVDSLLDGSFLGFVGLLVGLGLVVGFLLGFGRFGVLGFAPAFFPRGMVGYQIDGLSNHQGEKNETGTRYGNEHNTPLSLKSMPGVLILGSCLGYRRMEVLLRSNRQK